MKVHIVLGNGRVDQFIKRHAADAAIKHIIIRDHIARARAEIKAMRTSGKTIEII